MVAEDRRSAVLLPASIVLTASLLEPAQHLQRILAPWLSFARTHGRDRVAWSEGARATKLAQVTQVTPVIAGVPRERRGVAGDRRQVSLAAVVAVAVEKRADSPRRRCSMRAMRANVVAASNVAEAVMGLRSAEAVPIPVRRSLQHAAGTTVRLFAARRVEVLQQLLARFSPIPKPR